MTLRRASFQAGYSLVEVMVVLAVIALLSGAAVLMLPGGDSPAQEAADRLALDLMRAERAAITSGDFIGLDLTTSGYAFTRFNGEGWQRGEPGGLRAVDMADGVFLRSSAAAETEDAPDYWFDPTGVNEAASFVIDDGDRLVQIHFEAGQVRIEGEGA